jgi:hypothetical protein
MLHLQCRDDSGGRLYAPAFKKGVRQYPAQLSNS